MPTEHNSHDQPIREPYVGPRPFEERDEDIFFGREQETSELASLIISHPVVLLYAQSGAGKTSLLKASLIPMLKRRKLEVFPPARVRGQDAQLAEVTEETNIYIYNALGYLFHNRPYRDGRDRLSLAAWLPPRETSSKREVLPLRVVIFDQFEELFTVYPERFEERNDFFEQVHHALNADPLLRFVFAMREDFIAELDPYTSILPEKLQTRYRLMRLNEHAARAAVEKPLEIAKRPKTIRYVFEPEAADKLVDNLRTIHVKTPNGEKQVLGPFVEPVHLQVICQTLWRKLDSSFSMRASTQIEDFKITKEYVEEFGNVNQALSEFYEESLQKALKAAEKEKSNKTPKLSDGVLRAWFSRTLITPEGTRGIVFSGRKDRSVAGIPKSAVSELESQRLIRAELRGGEIWYELSHDRFIQPIRDSNETWLSRQPQAERKGQDLETRTAEWVRSSKNRSLLLNTAELQDAKHWMESPEGAAIGWSDTLFAFIQASQSARQQRRVRQLVAGAAVLGVLLFMTLLSSVYAFQQRRAAEVQKFVALQAEARALAESRAARDAEANALTQQKVAEEQRRIAMDESNAARKAEALAKQQQRIATVSRAEAETQRVRAITEAQIAEKNLADAIREREQVLLGLQAAGSAFSPDGKLLVTLSESEGARLWDVRTGQEIARLEVNLITAAVFDPSGKLIATAGQDKVVKLWSVDHRRELSSLVGHTDSVRKLVFSPDARYLVTASDDKTARIWEVATGREMAKLLGHTRPVTDVAFSPDGNTILTASTDGTIRVWDSVTGKEIRTITTR